MTTSTPKIIRGDEIEGFDRWELPLVDEPSPAATEAAAAPPGPTVRELEELQQVAYEEGFAAGRAAGFEQGREEGRAEGRKEGHAEGYAQGREEGFAAGEREARELVERMRRILDALAAPARQLDDEVEQALSRLAMTLARQIIHHELTVQPAEILTLVRRTVAMLPLAEREVRIHLHPDDASFLRQALAGSDEAASWRLVEDASLARGGCRVVSGSSRIDASLEHRLALLAEQLLSARSGEDEGAADAVVDDEAAGETDGEVAE